MSNIGLIYDMESDTASDSAKMGIIGQFGVGFYSTFMVGHNVKVWCTR